MKKTLLGLFAVVTLLAQSSFAACPLQRNANPCDTPNPCQREESPCDTPNPCKTDRCTGEDWLTQENIEDYFSRMNLDSAQRCQAMNALQAFQSKTSGLASGECASKCDCRAYRHALKQLDCDMKRIITSCQNEGYRSVRRDVKNHVKCTHKCLINPFTRCASCEDTCD